MNYPAFYVDYRDLSVKFGPDLFFKVEMDITTGCVRLVSKIHGPDDEHMVRRGLTDEHFRYGIDRNGYFEQLGKKQDAVEFVRATKEVAEIFNIPGIEKGKLGVYSDYPCVFVPRGRAVRMKFKEDKLAVNEMDAQSTKECFVTQLQFDRRGRLVLPVRKAMALIIKNASFIVALANTKENRKLVRRYNSIYLLVTLAGTQQTMYRHDHF